MTDIKVFPVGGEWRLFPDGDWHHLAVVPDESGGFKLYLNGVHMMEKEAK